MPLRTGGRGGTNEIYLLTNYVLLNRHNVILYRVDADSAGTWEFSCTNANYVLSGVVLTGNHLYTVLSLAHSIESRWYRVWPGLVPTLQGTVFSGELVVVVVFIISLGRSQQTSLLQGTLGEI